MTSALLLALMAYATPDALSSPPESACDVDALAARAHDAKDAAQLRRWAGAVAAFREACGSAKWRLLAKQGEVQARLEQLAIGKPSGGHTATNHTQSTGDHGHARPRIRIELDTTQELALLALRFEAASATCPDLRACSTAQSKDAVAALRSYVRRALSGGDSDQDRLLRLSELLRRFGGRFGDLPDAEIERAIRLAPVLHDMRGVQFDPGMLQKVPPALASILALPDTGERQARLIDYFEKTKPGDQGREDISLLAALVEADRLHQDIRRRIVAGQVSGVNLDISRVGAGPNGCDLRQAVRDAALEALDRTGYADGPGVHIDGVCDGAPCPVALVFATAPCPPAEGDDSDGGVCVELRSRFALAGERTQPIPAGAAATICKGGDAGRAPLRAALHMAVEEINRTLAVSSTTSGPPLLTNDTLSRPMLVAERPVPADGLGEGVWLSVARPGAPEGFGAALAHYLSRFKPATFGPISQAPEAAPGQPRLEWDRVAEGALIVRLTGVGALEPDRLQLRFTPKDLEMSPAGLALSTSLEVFDYYARNHPIPQPLPPPPPRAARATNLLLAGYPGLTDGAPGNDRISRGMATLDAILMGSAAVLAATAMGDRTLYHDGDVDSLTLSRWTFGAAEVALGAALLTKLYALYENP